MNDSTIYVRRLLSLIFQITPFFFQNLPNKWENLSNFQLLKATKDPKTMPINCFNADTWSSDIKKSQAVYKSKIMAKGVFSHPPTTVQRNFPMLNVKSSILNPINKLEENFLRTFKATSSHVHRLVIRDVATHD